MTPEAGSPLSGPRDWRWGLLVCLSLIVLVLCVYGQAYHFDFVDYDDNEYVTENTHVLRGLSLDNLRWVMLAGIVPGGIGIDFWRPLSMGSHMLDVELFGLHAGAHHAVNVLLHAMNTVLLFLVLRSMTGAFWRSALVAALWSLHPLRAESVAWVTERKDVLSGLFFLLTLAAYTRYARRPRNLGNYLLVCLCFLLGLMSKPMLVTLPCVLLLMDWWPLRRWGRGSGMLWLLLEKVPLLALSGVVAVMTSLASVGGNATLMSHVPLVFRVANALESYVLYLRQMLWPFGLAVFYPHPGDKMAWPKVLLALLILTGLTWLALRWWRMRPYVGVGWFWYLGTLLPVIGILQSGEQAHADRYTYLPTIGILIALVWGVEEGTKGARWRGRKQNTPVALGVILSLTLAILATLTALSWRQASLWADNENLWRHTISVTTENELADYQLAGTLIERNHILEAIPILKEALRIVPKDPEVLYSLANLYYRRGQFEEALNDYRLSLRYGNKAEAHCNLGSTLYHLGRREEASDEYREAIKARPGYVNAHYNLGRVLIELGSGGEGVDELRKALKLNPSSSKARHELGKFLYQQGQRKEGIEEMNGAVDLDPSSTAIKNDLAWMLATAPESSLRNGPRSLELAIRAENENPGPSPMILRTLAAAFAEIGDYPKAREAAGLALKLSKASSDAALADDLSRKIILLESEKPLRDP